MIKVTNRYLEELVVAQMQQWYSEHRFPFKFMYWIGRAVEKGKSEFKHFNEARLEIFKMYAEMDNQGKPKIDKEKNLIVFKDEASERSAIDAINELREQEVELPIDPIEVDLDDVKFSDVSFAEMNILTPLIVAKGGK